MRMFDLRCRVAVVLLAVAAGAPGVACSRPEPVTLTVSAAADLKYAFEELGEMFQQETGIKTTFNFGSSGQLAQQVEQGAPVDVFAAANVSYVDDLARKGLIAPDTRALYARGAIVMWTRADSALTFQTLQDLAGPEVRRIAIANPDHAPYGVAARQALQASGLWDRLGPKLVLGENVRQTLQYAETGNVDVAIVALSLAVAVENGRWFPISQELHDPIDQALAVVASTKHRAEARAFAAFVSGPEGRSVMRRYGFVLPGEEPGR